MRGPFCGEDVSTLLFGFLVIVWGLGARNIYPFFVLKVVSC